MEFTQQQELFQEIVHKAWEDTAFKEELVKNPIDTIEKLTGKRLQAPEGKTFVIRDQTDESTIYINIPAEQNLDDIELNEEQLEIVAGGGNPYLTNIIKDPFGGGEGCFPDLDIIKPGEYL